VAVGDPDVVLLVEGIGGLHRDLFQLDDGTDILGVEVLDNFTVIPRAVEDEVAATALVVVQVGSMITQGVDRFRSAT